MKNIIVVVILILLAFLFGSLTSFENIRKYLSQYSQAIEVSVFFITLIIILYRELYHRLNYESMERCLEREIEQERNHIYDIEAGYKKTVQKWKKKYKKLKKLMES